MSQSPISQTVSIILEGFVSYIESFHILTDKAPDYFKVKGWNAMQQNHRTRLRLYKDQVRLTLDLLQSILSENSENLDFWKAAKLTYSDQISQRTDRELAETFFNSVIRKSYSGFAINKDFMFIYEGYNSCQIFPNDELYHSYPSTWELRRIIQTLMDDFDFGVPYLNKEEDVEFLIKSVQDIILTRYIPTPESTTQVLKSVFYRNKGAYVIGRIKFGGKWMPFIIPFLNGPKGVFADTMIFDPNLMSGLFSFSRLYFTVSVAIPSQMVSFLSAVIPNKKTHELYNAIGFNKHGKTEFYRDFLIHLDQSQDEFVLAEGVKGMVMTVFTLPSYNVVFKMIKDYFDPPKTMTRQEVREKYKLVGLHDRVGRMADTHEFEEFHLPLSRIAPELMAELVSTVNSLIEITETELILKHVYIERKMIPLNIFLDTCSTEDAKQAVEEYGDSILELAKANIFPGDMMTKNFGVTRQKRVIFYDYDEIEFLTDMNFREKPKPETYEQIYASTPWYDIAANDVFPGDFKKFMIGRQDVKDHFFEYHAALFDPTYWQSIQANILAGEKVHAFSYPQKLRFRPKEEI